MTEISYKDGIFSIEVNPAPRAEDLADDELTAMNIILEPLRRAVIDISTAVVRRTSRYLTITLNSFLPFCNFKAIGKALFIELCICDKNDVKRLSAMPNYSALYSSRKKFVRFPVSSVEEFSNYSDGILSAYNWIKS